jgi:hypothetical protein
MSNRRPGAQQPYFRLTARTRMNLNIRNAVSRQRQRARGREAPSNSMAGMVDCTGRRQAANEYEVIGDDGVTKEPHVGGRRRPIP